MLRLQRAAPRYYQRPDAPHVSVDPTATSLSGWSGRVGLNKNSGNITFNAGLWGISPGFEPNDLGYATQTDRGGAHGQVLFRKLTPGRVDPHPAALRREVVDLQLREREPGRRRGVASAAQLRNYWQLDFDARQVLEHLGRQAHARRADHHPARHREPEPRRHERLPPALLGLRAAALSNREFGGRSRQYSATLNLRPWTALTLSATPTYLRSRTIAQYLATVPDATAASTFGSRYVFGGLEQPSGRSPCA